MCAPPEEEEEVDREPGTDFEAALGGGFDEGMGTTNVSSEVDAENLVICVRGCVCVCACVCVITCSDC